jgi:hypothetical protein
LRRISLCPWRIGVITAAALVLLHTEHTTAPRDQPTTGKGSLPVVSAGTRTFALPSGSVSASPCLGRLRTGWTHGGESLNPRIESLRGLRLYACQPHVIPNPGVVRNGGHAGKTQIRRRHVRGRAD